MATNEQLQEISALAFRMKTAQEKITDLEEQLKEANEDLTRLQEIDLPEAMNTAGMKSFQLLDGSSVALKTDLYASFPKKPEQHAAAVQWLVDNCLDDVLKNDVVVSFGRGQNSAAAALLNDLRGRGLNYEQKETVHPQTLKALLKEQMALGKIDVPLDTFNAYVVTKAVVKPA